MVFDSDVRKVGALAAPLPLEFFDCLRRRKTEDDCNKCTEYVVVVRRMCYWSFNTMELSLREV